MSITAKIQFTKDFKTKEPNHVGSTKHDYPTQVIELRTVYGEISYPKGVIVEVEILDRQGCVFVDIASQMKFTVPDDSFYVYV